MQPWTPLPSQLLLLSVSYGTEHSFGQSGLAVLALPFPTSCALMQSLAEGQHVKQKTWCCANTVEQQLKHFFSHKFKTAYELWRINSTPARASIPSLSSFFSQELACAFAFSWMLFHTTLFSPSYSHTFSVVPFSLYLFLELWGFSFTCMHFFLPLPPSTSFPLFLSFACFCLCTCFSFASRSLCHSFPLPWSPAHLCSFPFTAFAFLLLLFLLFTPCCVSLPITVSPNHSFLDSQSLLSCSFSYSHSLPCCPYHCLLPPAHCLLFTLLLPSVSTVHALNLSPLFFLFSSVMLNLSCCVSLPLAQSFHSAFLLLPSSLTSLSATHVCACYSHLRLLSCLLAVLPLLLFPCAWHYLLFPPFSHTLLSFCLFLFLSLPQWSVYTPFQTPFLAYSPLFLPCSFTLSASFLPFLVLSYVLTSSCLPSVSFLLPCTSFLMPSLPFPSLLLACLSLTCFCSPPLSLPSLPIISLPSCWLSQPIPHSCSSLCPSPCFCAHCVLFASLSFLCSPISTYNFPCVLSSLSHHLSTLPLSLLLVHKLLHLSLTSTTPLPYTCSSFHADSLFLPFASFPPLWSLLSPLIALFLLTLFPCYHSYSFCPHFSFSFCPSDDVQISSELSLHVPWSLSILKHQSVIRPVYSTFFFIGPQGESFTVSKNYGVKNPVLFFCILLSLSLLRKSVCN